MTDVQPTASTPMAEVKPLPDLDHDTTSSNQADISVSSIPSTSGSIVDPTESVAETADTSVVDDAQSVGIFTFCICTFKADH